MSSERVEIVIGLERCVTERPAALEGARIGLLMNRASIDCNLRLSCDVMNDVYPGQLAALFSPQHGMWGEQQANMIETPHGRHPRLDIPVYSLYGETRKPTAEMLAGLSCFVVDLQDVGTRVYTFAWTVLYCLEACAAHDIPVVILDRPNPLGNRCEGPLLDGDFRSFVGGASIPMRHGLTLGELARLLNSELGIHAELDVIRVEGCPPGTTFDRLARHWIPPSPNLPTFQSALVYPGQVLLEGTNLSEGRGTTTPFEICGAPFIDADRLCDLLREFDLPGVRFLPIQFRPTFDKWAGHSCGGVTLHMTDPEIFRPYRTSVTLLAAVFQCWPESAQWLAPPYEYEFDKTPIDILSGSRRLRTTLSGGGAPVASSALDDLCRIDNVEWKRRVQIDNFR